MLLSLLGTLTDHGRAWHKLPSLRVDHHHLMAVLRLIGHGDSIGTNNRLHALHTRLYRHYGLLRNHHRPIGAHVYLLSGYHTWHHLKTSLRWHHSRHHLGDLLHWHPLLISAMIAISSTTSLVSIPSSITTTGAVPLVTIRA